MTHGLDEIADTLRQSGFAFVPAARMTEVLDANALAHWDSFAASWDDLGLDTYMADGGRYRRRRHAAFSSTPDGLRRKPDQPHYQSRDYNQLNGGIARWFDPMTPATAANPVTSAILRCCQSLFHDLTPPETRPASWHVETHQFRIEARPDQQGQPTPEGLHRDGVDWVLVLLVARRNIASGETTIHDLARHPLGSFTLTDPLDAALVDDALVYHGVTGISPQQPDRPAYRDVLVVTFRRE